jgi:hypothetical protein
MDIRDTWDPMTQTRTDSTSRTESPGTDAGGRLGGGLLVGLVALACPLLCVGPLVLAALASTGVARVLRGAPWPVIAAAVLVGVALGVWGVRARGTRRAGDCCAPTRLDTLREVHDENAT